MTKLTPAGFTPPYPAWRVADGPALTFTAIGVQEHDSGAAAEVLARLTEALGGDLGPRHHEIVDEITPTLVPGRGTDHVVLAYWDDPERWRGWRAGPGALLDVPLDGPLGTWTETFSAPATHYRTSYSTPEHRWGLALWNDRAVDELHAYYGAARDSIRAAEDGGLAPTVGRLTPGRAASTGQEVEVAIPGNACFIRTVQGWSECSDEERDHFLSDSYERYKEGVAFLAAHPEDTQCLAIRLVANRDAGPGRPQSETLAWFRSLADLEQWTWHHPTHEAIFAAFGAHAARFAPDVRVLLGHEIVVVPEGAGEAVYRNCREGTGLAPALASASVRDSGHPAGAALSGTTPG